MQQNILQHKITPKNQSQEWSPPTTSSLETEQVYSGRSRFKSGSKQVRKKV